RVFVLLPTGQNVVISDLRVEHGATDVMGAGILNFANLTLDGVVVADSNAKVAGGGIANVAGNLTLNGGGVAFNVAGQAGGGIFSASNGNLHVNQATIWRNTSTAGGGVAFE